MLGDSSINQQSIDSTTKNLIQQLFGDDIVQFMFNIHNITDYKDEVCVILFNLGDQPFEIKPGDRIAQGVIMKIEKVNLTKVDVISRDGDRGGGLGHTGIN